MELKKTEEGMAVNGKYRIVAGSRRLPREDVGLNPADCEGRFVVNVHGAKRLRGEDTWRYVLSD